MVKFIKVFVPITTISLLILFFWHLNITNIGERGSYTSVLAASQGGTQCFADPVECNPAPSQTAYAQLHWPTIKGEYYYVQRAETLNDLTYFGPTWSYVYVGAKNTYKWNGLTSNKTYWWGVWGSIRGYSKAFSFTTPNCVTPAPTVDLTTWPTWELPDPIHLRWTSTNADSCNASGDWSGNKPTQGDEYLSKPRGTYTFILTCTGPGGSASDSVTVRVIQVPQCTFTANPTTIILPASSTLSWECIYADSCSIDQGIGSVNNVSGTKQVRPTKTTTYTLTCQGPDGDGNTPLQTSVNVGFVPWIKEVIPR